MNFLSLDIPVFQGGMGVGVSLGGLAGAVAAQGGAGTISTAQIGFKEADFEKNPLKANLRAIGKEIAKAREIAGGKGAVGVNIMAATYQYAEYVKEAVKQKADFIVSGAGLPMDLPALTKNSNVKIIPIVSSVKAASVICRRWLKRDARVPDAVIIEGPEAGGHLGFSAEYVEQHDYRDYKSQIKEIIAFIRKFGQENNKYIPVITAGGYRTPEDLQEQRMLGADGIQVASAFVTTEECDADLAFKQAYINCKKEDIGIIKSPVGMPGRAIRNRFVQRVEQNSIAPEKCYHCISTCNPTETPYCITRALINGVQGDVENGLIFCGANAWKEERIRTVKDVIDEICGMTKK
jgi:nitronate monooxygenase